MFMTDTLTDRQCWDVMRRLVKDKNNEYQRFLSWNFNGDNIMRTICQGHTRDYFLLNYGIQYDEHKMGKDWLKSLSAEDLLIFLDFRCRALQSMYDITGFDGKYGRRKLDEAQICNVISKTPLSKYAQWGDCSQQLMLTGRPKKIRGEADIADITDKFEFNQVAKTGLTMVMGSLYYNYIQDGGLDGSRETISSEMSTTTRYYGSKYPRGIHFKGIVPLPERAKDAYYAQKGNEYHALAKIVGFDAQNNPIQQVGDKLYVNGERFDGELEDLIVDSETLDYFSDNV